jgi:transcription-repair coupling factor (superfamily II helicase)
MDRLEELSNLVPKAKIGLIHGRLDKHEIEDVLIHFYAHEIDILLCTTIIEHGLDVAAANTIFIEDADKFGLAQLYQIKGRVGRSSRIAYAYLLYDEEKQLKADGKERLRVIEEFTELGSGYKIAEQDLMLRGAGDVLGVEQSGFIESVGIDLYLKILNEVVIEKGRQGKGEKSKEAAIYNIDAYVPDSYVKGDAIIEIYQKIGSCENEAQLKDAEYYVRDVYGTLPPSVITLFQKKRLDLLCRHDAITSVSENPNFVEILLSVEAGSIPKIGVALFTKFADQQDGVFLVLKEKRVILRIAKNGDWLGKTQVVLEEVENMFDEHAAMFSPKL